MASVEQKGVGGIFEMTGREIGVAVEQTYAWGEEAYKQTGMESLVNSIAPTIESLFRNFGATLENLPDNLGRAISQASEPPILGSAAHQEPKKKGLFGRNKS